MEMAFIGGLFCKSFYIYSKKEIPYKKIPQYRAYLAHTHFLSLIYQQA